METEHPTTRSQLLRVRRKLTLSCRLLTRRVIAARFLRGEGLEIGALHLPLPLPRRARARYFDRVRVSERAGYIEEHGWCIHFHAWTRKAFQTMLERLRDELGFPLEVNLIPDLRSAALA